MSRKAALFSLFASLPAFGGEGNRLAHLDQPNNPWQFSRDSPALITPQWIGEPGVEGVVVLAIDDMSGDGQGFRDYLTPIIGRLQEIDGRGPVSITCNRPDVEHENMQWFLEQGVSLESHTLTHPCPLLQRRDFRRARADYHGCVDLLARIPNSRSVGFRFPCMDGQNTPSPRAYAELLSGVSDNGLFNSMSTSVGIVFTPRDPALPEEVFGTEGAKRFSKYLMKGFVNYLEDYPYPFVVGGKIWELPFVYPNDYTGHALHGGQNPITIADFKAAIDATIIKQGAVSLCFHSGGWMRPDQMVDIVDHSDREHGRKVKFLNMAEMHERMVKHLLAGHPLRNEEGGDNGVRVFDIDDDGYMDVLIANEERKVVRLWQPERRSWAEFPFPTELGPGLHFGIVGGRTVALSMSRDTVNGAWIFTGEAWTPDPRLLAGVDFEALKGTARLRDINGDGNCELINANAVYRFDGTQWRLLPFKLPAGTAMETAAGGDAGLRFADIDADGKLDVIFSNHRHWGTWLFESMDKGWARKGLEGARENPGVGEQHPRERDVLPPIVRADGTNNGAWVKRGHLYWQNEDTGALLPHHIDQRSFGDLMGEQVNQPRTPAAALKAMHARPGFRVELVAAEPLVMDPVDIAWGPDGRLWVCEMADYPLGIDNKGKPGSRIAFLTDTNGDLRYDQRTLFADGLEVASTVLPWRDGVLIVAAPNIWFMRDTDGDGVADEKRVLYEGLGRGNEQHRSNGLAWGLDGWLYVANGDSGGTVRSTKTGKSLELGGFDLRIKPDSGELEHATGVTQHGRNRDDFGNWVAGNNSGGWQIVLGDHDIRRNPAVTPPAARHTLHGVIDLYPASQVLSHWSGYRAPPAGSPGKLTSGCAYTFYRDSLFDGSIEPSVFFSCPVHNCVHRDVIQWDGMLMQTARAKDEARSEFLRSADSWFRPTAIRTGPDGALYVADMHRLVIEHPEWIDDTLEREMIADGRLRAGHDRGRIYRVFPAKADLRKRLKLAGLPPTGLAAAIDSPNGWQRDTAHMMLTWLEEGERKKLLGPLRKILRESPHAAARAQAASALADIGWFSPDDATAGFADHHPGVRRTALRRGEELLEFNPALGEAMVALLEDPHSQVRMQAAYSIGAWRDRRAGKALGEFALRHADQPYLRAAALSSARRYPDEVLFALFAAERSPATAGLIGSMMEIFGSDDTAKLVPGVLKRLVENTGDGKYQAWQFAATARLLEAAGNSDETQLQLASMLKAASAVLRDPEALIQNRLQALTLLERADFVSDDQLVGLLNVSTPVELQVSAARALLADGDVAKAGRVLKNWIHHGAALRGAILDAMLERPALVPLLLSTVSDRSDFATSLSTAQRLLLLTHEDEAIRNTAGELFGGATSPDRAAVMKRYAAALSRPGDRDRGQTIFAALCASCHRLDGVGQVIGPDLAALSNRAPQTYLTGIIDPNRAVQANWMLFVAKTGDGRSLVGAVAEETSAAVTLVGIGGTRHAIPRRELVSLSSAGRSLMPEGLETSIDVGQMSDLLAYLCVAGEPRKQFANNHPALIKQVEDESLVLPASAAEVYGPAIVFEQKYRNLGFWSGLRDRAEWTFELRAGGEFDVWIDWALADANAGGRIGLAAGDQSLSGLVPGTGTWDDYRWGRVGTMKLTAGRHRMVASCEELPEGRCLIDLRHLRLLPRGSDGPKGGADWPGAANPR